MSEEKKNNATFQLLKNKRNDGHKNNIASAVY